MDCDSDGGEDGERVRLLQRPRTPSKAEWYRHVVSHMPFRESSKTMVGGTVRTLKNEPDFNF